MQQKEIDKLAKYYETHDLSNDIERGEVMEPLIDPMAVTSLRLPRPTMDAVREMAAQRGMRPTQLIREWIEAALAEQAGDDATVKVTDLMAFIGSRRSDPRRQPS